MRREKGVYHKTFYCNELRGLSDGERILDIFLLSDIKYCSNERGNKWLNATLSDRTGSIRARIWADKIQMEYESFIGQIVIVSGTIAFYAGKQEVIVEKMLPVKQEEYELSEIIKTLSKDKIQVYIEQIRTMIGNISSKDLQNFVANILCDENLDHMSMLPVKILGHHAYQGALLEHISEVVTGSYCFVKSTAVVRDIKVNLDLVIAGALLHDIACVQKFRAEGYIYQVKEAAVFCDNRYLTYQMLEKVKQNCCIEADIYQLLLHIIDTSHADGVPRTMEAMIVHNQNRLSAELDNYESAWQMAEKQKEGNNNIWSLELKRELYKSWR